MRIKTFQGRTLEDLLPEIREALGPNAVVLGQRAKVAGGIGGFFGTKVLEVTAADRMPDDKQLVELEDQLMNGGSGASGERAARDAAPKSNDPEEEALAQRFRAAMAGAQASSGATGLNVTDEWDPAQDAELAHEYGRVLEHAAAAGFTEMDVPVVPSAKGTTSAAAPSSPLEQARTLTERAHEHIASATRRVDHAPQQQSGTYAPPAPMPRTSPVEERARTFAASVLDAPMPQGPNALTHAAAPQTQMLHPGMEEAVRGDLGFGPGSTPNDRISDAIGAAIDMVDLRAIAALRDASDFARATRNDAGPTPSAEVTDAIVRLESVGVDPDVAKAITELARVHRMPFAGSDADLDDLVRDVVQETLSVRTGFSRATSSGVHTLALVGASSSGKSTVAAQLVHAYQQAGLRVALAIVVQNDPSVPIIQDPRFVTLGVEVRYIMGTEQAALASTAFASHDVVIVDTPGAAHRDAAVAGHVRSCLQALGVDDVHVVMPLATSSREAAAVVDAFQPLGANRLVVSRMAESSYIGQLLNFGFRLGLPMTFLSEGPSQSDDIHAASAREMSQRILSAATPCVAS
ncbi:MAG: GTP-binding signal recognition particle G-domain protein [Thermoleophilia bacterium]|nr:GTP-binding signal recognition particle G-domain protein [Thermoleophilia bacterium]